MATPQVKDLVLRSPAGSSEVVTFAWPLQVGTGQDKHDNGIDIIDTIKYVCEELPSISSAFDEIKFHEIDTACYKTMTNLVDRFNKAVDSIVALEKGTSLPAERLNKFANPCLLRHILQLVYNAAVLDPDKLNNYEPFSPEVYGETSYELVQQMIKHVTINGEDTFVDLGSGVGQVVLQMAGSFPLKACIGIEKADTPARYAERMDMYFRQFMAWFGKRYCEYKLIKGDFLVDEHREKITSSTLVFVNNFAFGPNVDHQLKERFADLRDGARVVSSKSFCPLNFRITDRNLSDIGTIMHVSEIPPLKGSVSWTCKPVSYYLHVIDRTILERYFQRVKTQKGAENEHTGSTRTTRDRAKREANSNAQNSNSNSNSNSSFTLSATTRTNSPANALTNSAAAAAAATKTTRQQQREQQQQQRNMADMDTSTESDGDVNNGTANGPMTRKVWSDWCSSKEKSSQSDDEELNNNNSNNNNNNNTNNNSKGRTAAGRSLSATPATTNNANAAQKKRKKLTRKAAIASKSAAAAAREREAAEIAAAAQEAALKEDGNSSTTTTTTTITTGGTGAKGRKKGVKRGARGRKSLKIVGLDVLHKQTLLSTSVEALSKKLPAAPGCVDQQLTSLLTRNMSHAELDIPEAPQDTPYALQILLDVFRSQYMTMIENMRSSAYVPKIKQQIKFEQDRMQRIKNRASQLEKQIRVLIDDSVALLKVRMNELGINVSSPNDLIAKAKEIVGRHKELQCMAKRIQSQVTTCEMEQKRMLRKQLQHLPEYQNFYGSNGKTKLELPNGTNELSEAAAHELVLREIANTLAQRKKLYAQVSSIEKEAATLEKAADERRTAAALLAQGTNMTLATTAAAAAQQQQLGGNQAATLTMLPQPLQLTTNGSNSSIVVLTAAGNKSGNAAAAATTNTANAATKSSRRSRDHRTRSQEWPDVPDVGKIEESNPEVLAQKILETGRQIEAGKFIGNAASANFVGVAHAVGNKHAQQYEEKRGGRSGQSSRSSSGERAGLMQNQSIFMLAPQDSTLMPAPASNKQQQQQQQQQQLMLPVNCTRGSISILPKCELPGRKTAHSNNNAHNNNNNNSNNNNANVQESPKVANFEDRLKSIITSALNEDQEHRKAVAQHHVEVIPTLQQSPAPPKRSKQTASSSSVATLTPVSVQPLNPPAAIPHNLSNIITVATQGLTHLNANTTISPITPPLAQASTNNINQLPTTNTSPYGSKYKHAVNTTTNSAQQQQQQLQQAHKYNAHNKSKEAAYNKYHQNQHHTHQSHQSQQQNQLQHSAYVSPSSGAAATADAAVLQHYRRRGSISAANFEQFAQQQQQQQAQQLHHHQQQQQHQHHQAYMLAAAAAANSTTSSSQHVHGAANHAHNALQPPLHAAAQSVLALEFKAPPMSASNAGTNSNEYHHQLQQQQRSGSREQLFLLAAAGDADAMPRSSSAHSADSTPNSAGVMYYAPTRERLVSLERSTSCESAAAHATQATLQHDGPSRPSSNSSQPDYTQVSPAKMALRRHLSQEKLNQHLPSGNNVGVVNNNAAGPPMSTKTIGDLVNGEIERTLEISHQSIINAVVNMSTVGANTTVERERERYMLERNSTVFGATAHNQHETSTQQQQQQQQQRLLINPNAQRPERVHVRVLDEATSSTNTSYLDTPRSKSPLGAHNLATLAHVAAYNQKSSGNHIIEAAAGNNKSNARQQYNNRDLPQSYQQHHQSGERNSSSVASISPRGSVANTRQGIDYQTVTLPRAEMKGCIEAYFNDEQHQREHQQDQQHHHHHQQQHQQQQQQQQQQHQQSHQQSLSLHKITTAATHKERVGGGRSGRMNNGNPPLEGLAASLQDHVMASRKFKEENERRAATSVANSSIELNSNHQHQHQHIYSTANHQRTQHHYQNHNNVSGGGTTTPMKVEIGVKRTSPMSTTNQPRPSKIPHYAMHDQQTLQHQNHNNINAQHQPSVNPYANTNGIGLYAGNANSHISTATNTTAAITHNNIQHYHQHQQQQQQQLQRQRNKLPLEPLLMSPEINSIMSGSANDEQRPLQLSTIRHQQQQQHQLQQQHQQHQQLQQQQQQHEQQQQHHMRTTTPLSVASSSGRRSTTANGAGDDDDVIADDETHWQHRVSSGIDRLVAFASTELDKTRRSIDGDTVPSSISCNTSPDSGITHSSSSSSNSDAARTFLSTSSTSSQLDLPISSGGSSSSSSFASSTVSNYLNQQHQHQHNHQHQMQHHNAHQMLHHNHLTTADHLSDSSMKSCHSDAPSMPIALKTTTLSPVDPSAIESPPLSDIGIPRTPSPSVVLATPTPPLLVTATLNANAAMQRNTPTPITEIMNTSNNSNNIGGASLKIPLKYQRKSKSSSEKHYKKKFCERNWKFDCDEILAYSNSTSDMEATANGETAADAAGNSKQELNSKSSNKSPKENHNNRDNNDSNNSTHALNNKSPTNTTSTINMNSSPNRQHHHHHHKSSKFRPKGKDWDWSLDGSNSNSSACKTESKSTTKNEPSTAITTTNIN